MGEFILFFCLVRPADMAIKCHYAVAPTEAVCLHELAEVEALAGFPVGGTCFPKEEASDDTT